MAVAQTAELKHPEKCTAFCPEVLLKKVIKESVANALAKSTDYGQNIPPRGGNGKHWEVYSDRDNNKTYVAPNGAPYKSLKFNQRVRIAQIKNGWALVYDDPIKDEPWPNISSKAEWLGWVPMRKLLLWPTAMADENSIFYKALLCVNLDDASNDLGKVYLDPQNKQYTSNVKSSMDFYFIMKREGDLALLSKSHSLNSVQGEGALVGWISKSSYVDWDQRTCIEPTWKKEDVEYFTTNNKKAITYEKKDNTKPVSSYSFSRKSYNNKKNTHTYRQNPHILRFPILDVSQDWYYCSTFGPADGSGANLTSVTAEVAEARMYNENQIAQLSNINIGIVIDGTSSMERFYPAVKEAIKTAVKVFESNKYKVKVGVVIYRDYQDGDNKVDIIKLTSPDVKNQALYSFLDNGGARGYGIKSHPSDRTYEEALFYGIDYAIDNIGFKKEQSNILFVIGDCGNSRSDLTVNQSDIIKKLASNNINIIGFQVRRQLHDAFDLFYQQLGEIIRESLKARYAELDKYASNPSSESTTVKMVRIKDGYKLVNEGGDLFAGSLNYPQAGQDMQTTKLSDLIIDATSYFSDQVKGQQRALQLADTPFNSEGNKEGYSKFELKFVEGRLGKERFEALRGKSLIFAFKGYTPKVDKESGREFYKPVIFISSDELGVLIESLRPVYDAATYLVQDATADRSVYIDALRSLISSHIGDKADQDLNIGDIMARVAGLNEAAASLKGEYTLEDLASPEIVGQNEFGSIVSRFTDRCEAIMNIKTKGYDFATTIAGQKYYWIPIEDLP